MAWFKLWHYNTIMLLLVGFGCGILASGNAAGWGLLAPGILLIVGFVEAKERL